MVSCRGGGSVGLGLRAWQERGGDASHVFGGRGHVPGAGTESVTGRCGENLISRPVTDPSKGRGDSEPVGVALLPNVACPACWPAYIGLLSSWGLSLLADTTYLLPLTALFLVLAVGALGFRAKGRRGHAPFVLGVLAASLVMVGKFVFDFDPALYGGIAILIAASVWNSWPRTKETRAPCPACAPAGASHEIGSTANEV